MLSIVTQSNQTLHSNAKARELFILATLRFSHCHTIRNKQKVALNQFYKVSFGGAPPSGAERQKCKHGYLINCCGRHELSGSPRSSSSCSCSWASSCWGSSAALLPRAPTAALRRSPPAPSSPCSSSAACRCADWASRSSPSGRRRERTGVLMYKRINLIVEIKTRCEGRTVHCSLSAFIKCFFF